MRKRSMLPYLCASAALFVVGLLLGAGKSSDDASAANTASKVLLTIGLLAMLVTGVLSVLARRRAQRAAR